jgi:uncharacterized membrane protein
MGLRLRRFDDEWTRRARRFQREMDRRGGDPEHPRLAKLDPAVLGALRLSRGDERSRWEIEARLLAGQDSSGIAARTGVEAEIVTAFEALSYDVRDRLHASDWILAECLGLRAVTGYTESDVDLIWKIFAYTFGPLGLDVLLDSLYGGSVSGIRVEGHGPETEYAHRLRVLIATMTLPKDEESALRVIQLAQRQSQVEREIADRSARVVMAPLVVPEGFLDAIVSDTGSGSGSGSAAVGAGSPLTTRLDRELGVLVDPLAVAHVTHGDARSEISEREKRSA